MRAALGVNLQEFLSIKDYMEGKGVELGSRGVSAEASLAMGLWTLRTGDSTRHTAEAFGQRSLDTVTESLWTVVLALSSEEIVDEWIRIPSADEPDHPQIKDYSPLVFAGCRGALDGTHIGVKVPKRVEDVYVSRRGRKDKTTINVFAACNFDLDFIAIHAGVEGSAHDSRVLEMARATGNFAMPPGLYLLGDASYGLSKDVLTPHRSVKYRTWEPGAVPSSDVEEFNRQHASLHNCIERAFDLLKSRFGILREPLRQRLDQQ